MPHFEHVMPREAFNELLTLRKNFMSTRCIFVKSERMIPILKSLGARSEDFETIPETSNTLQHDPTLPFRRSKNGRFCFDFKEQRLQRLDFQPFILASSEDFVRHDSGKVRRFEEIEDDLQQNTVLKALFIFKSFMINGVQTKHRPLLDYEQVSADGTKRDQYVCTLFHLRTVTQPGLLGEPALEGVHSDGVDFTMTTFLGSKNMAKDAPKESAVTFLHTLDETNGIRYSETNPKHLMGSVQHRDLLDTLLIVDHERKHSLSPVWQVDEQEAALRDMLIFFTRRPVMEGHHSHPYDAIRPHLDMPMSVDLRVL